jgi:ankyrin repeat protein
VFHPCDEELLLRITTCLAQNGYHKEVGVMVQLNKAFWTDEQIWDAYKDYAPGPKGKTRLIYASGRGLLGRVQRLLARGARINLGAESDGTTPLMMASQNGRLEIVRELCGKGANVNAAMTNNGFTALMWACQNGHLEIARELLARGANVNAAMTDNGGTALHLASLKSHLEIARLLLQKGANKAAISMNGFTAFCVASGPHKAALQALLRP